MGSITSRANYRPAVADVEMAPAILKTEWDKPVPRKVEIKPLITRSKYEITETEKWLKTRDEPLRNHVDWAKISRIEPPTATETETPTT